MTEYSPAERALFSDLTRILMAMRDAPHAALEARVEERFRDFVRKSTLGQPESLQITLTWSLPEGAEEWAVYGTEYKVLPAEAPLRRQAVGGASADADLPASSASDASPRPSAEIIAFPVR